MVVKLGPQGYLCAWIDTHALHKILRIPYTCYITNVQVRAMSGCPLRSNMVTERRLRFCGCTSHTVLLMKTITVQLLLRFASLHQTGNDLQEDPTTRAQSHLTGSETAVLPMHARRQPLENTAQEECAMKTGEKLREDLFSVEWDILNNQATNIHCS